MKTNILISIWIRWITYLFIYFLHPTPHFWGLKAFKNHFFLKIFILNFSFWRKVSGKEKHWCYAMCVMAICIFACYESRHSLVLVWWVLLWHRFYVNSRMWEGGTKYMLGRHYPMEASLVKSIWKGLGFLPSSDFLFFWWWILTICEKCFGKRIPPKFILF